MIYTVTLNPAVDYVVSTGEMTAGTVNRAKSAEIFFGGKGINVSTVLNELGISSTALGFIAGFTGEAVEKGVAEMGVKTDFVRLENGFSRINVKIRSEASGTETELNGQGPAVGENALNRLFEKLDRVEDGDTLVLAGSIPGSMAPDIYERILDRLQNEQGKRINAVVDAAGDLLLNVLKYEPFLVKPNNFELGEMFGTELETREDIEKYARRLRDMGARNVLVSMAGDGALLLDESGAVRTCGVCRGTVRSSVGAGDSMVAGFIAGYERGDLEYALRLGTAAGGATAFSDGLGKKEDIYRLLEQLQEVDG